MFQIGQRVSQRALMPLTSMKTSLINLINWSLNGFLIPLTSMVLNNPSVGLFSLVPITFFE